MFLGNKSLWIASALAAAISLSGCNFSDESADSKDDSPTDVNEDGPDNSPEEDEAQTATLAPYDQRDIRDDVFYFVMPDRFNNGSAGNDYGGLSGDRLTTGFDPTDEGFFHGGDLLGLQDKLDYLEGMGITAIWMTPVLKNKAVQGEGDGASAAYHGYWTLDFTQIDPHLGTGEDLKNFIAAAHERDIKVFFDIITNHTADVIKYEECHDLDGTFKDGVTECAYKSLEDVASGDEYTPFFPAGEESAKAPAWLNDKQNYHNQGGKGSTVESQEFGDFDGLDDLATSEPVVVDGMIEIFKNIVTEYKPDGFRIDTVKHVDTEFWQEFSPALMDHAKAEGISNFTMFGEAYISDAASLSFYTSEAKLPSVIDFAFQGTVKAAVAEGGTPDALRGLFNADDYYADHDSDASTLMTFTGNHDMGRFGYFLGANDTADNLAKTKLAHAMMYFLRGVPVVYYGDEQGFAGIGDDKEARQDMFPTQVEKFKSEVQIGTSATPADANFDTDHPIYKALADYAEVTRNHVALRRGIQHERYAESGTRGAYVVSRVDVDERVEYLVAFNTSNIEATAYVEAAASGYEAVYGAEGSATLDQGDVKLTIPPYGIVIYKANEAMASSPAPSIAMTGFEEGEGRTGTLEIGLDVTDLDALALPDYTATFEYSTDDGSTWQRIAEDRNAPYRAFMRLGEFEDGTNITVQATMTNADGETDVATRSFIADSRFPETVVVDYNNTNTRDALYVVSNSGEFQGPITSDAGTYSFTWGAEDTSNLLIWASLDDEAGTVGFDQPFQLTREAMLTHTTEDANGDLIASFTVDAQAEVSLTNTEVDQIVKEGKATDANIDGLNLRGGIVGWDQASAVDMNNTEYATYHTEAYVQKGMGEFKFADDGWTAINMGGEVTHQGLTQDGNSGNLTNTFEADSVYDFWVVGVDQDADGSVDLRVPFVGIDHGSLGQLIYLRGSLTDWEALDAQLTHRGNDIYSLTLNNLAAGDYEFKVADGDWGDINWGYSSVTIDAESVTLTDPGNGNIGLSVASEDDYTFTIDASDPTSPMLKVESSEVPPYDAEGTLYLLGELNDWTDSPAYEMGYVGNGLYQTTVGIDPSSFDYSKDAATAIDFAIAKPWTFKLAGAASELTEGGSVTLSDSDDANNTMDASLSAGYYDLVLDASADASNPTLSLAANVDHNYGDLFGKTVYLRGGFNGWNTDNEIVHTGLTYSQTLTLTAGTYEFKIANSDWSTEVAYGDIVQNGGIELTNAKGNISVAIPADGDYVFTLDVTNPVRKMLTVEAATP